MERFVLPKCWQFAMIHSTSGLLVKLISIFRVLEKDHDTLLFLQSSFHCVYRVLESIPDRILVAVGGHRYDEIGDFRPIGGCTDNPHRWF
jgi:hypothetical protein